MARPGSSGFNSPRRVLLSSYSPEVYCWRPSSRGGRGGSTALLRAVDVDLRLGIVVLVILRTGAEKVFLAVHVAACACRRVCGVVGSLLSGGRAYVLRGGLVRRDRLVRRRATLGSTSSLCWPRCCFGLPPSPRHHKVTTGYQRDSGGRCPGTVPKVAFCVTSHVYAPRRGSDLRVGLGTRFLDPLRVPNPKPSASRF